MQGRQQQLVVKPSVNYLQVPKLQKPKLNTSCSQRKVQTPVKHIDTLKIKAKVQQRQQVIRSKKKFLNNYSSLYRAPKIHHHCNKCSRLILPITKIQEAGLKPYQTNYCLCAYLQGSFHSNLRLPVIDGVRSTKTIDIKLSRSIKDERIPHRLSAIYNSDSYGMLNITNNFKLKLSNDDLEDSCVSGSSIPLEESTIQVEQKDFIQTKITGYQYKVTPGNNSGLIVQLLKLRDNWVQGEVYSECGFIWHPTYHKIRFDRLVPYQPAQIVNHFKLNSVLTNKLKLFQNLQKYCISRKMDVNNLMPLTYCIEFDSKRLKQQYSLFCSFFKTMIGEKSRSFKLFSFDQSQKITKLPTTHNTGQNIWIIKPSGFNRGRGIYLFNKISELSKLVQKFKKEIRQQIIRESKLSLNSANFVIQKYIESPLLYYNRKFDIRMWVLVTQNMSCYIYPQGYLRTSSKTFTNDVQKLGNEQIHLTNNAIQKNFKGYGKFEQGNQVSFIQFEEFLKEFHQETSFSNIYREIKQLVYHSLMSVKSLLNSNNHIYCYEVFGYDFIIDSQMKVWLIEVNTNPCLELSSPLLEYLIPRMMNEAMELTVDIIFPQFRDKRDLKNENILNLPDGNLWEKVVALKNVMY